MATARKFILANGEGVYHCISRCVRRAFLCGVDNLSGKNFNHRKAWVRDRLVFLRSVFVIDALGYALMSNHQHTLLRTRPDLLKKLSDESIARRWLTLYPPSSGVKGKRGEADAEAISMLAKNKKRIKVLRKRLGSISWFMKSVNEYLARRANAEDDCKGRFWEGRFKCQRLHGEAAILSCSVYIDLNLIRAGVASTPETSAFTGAWERIRAYKEDPTGTEESSLWLAPIHNTKDRLGFLSIKLPEYLEILDQTGRELRLGKRGCISTECAPILSRLGVKTDRWLETVSRFGRSFSSIAGNQSTLEECAVKQGKQWLKGLNTARRAFF